MRLDEILVAKGLVASRARARDAVLRGCVRVDGREMAKPAARVAEDASIEVDDPSLAWVSRAALKLVAALDEWRIDPQDRICLDLGASTGGFTQVLLARGARRVHAIDVGHGQMDSSLAADPRIVLREGLNARSLSVDDVPEEVGLIVADLSFISLRLALPPALRLAAPEAALVALVKPQFEVGRESLGKGGIVRDSARAAAAAEEVAAWVETLGWTRLGLIASPIAGGSGNREFLLGVRRD